MPLDTPFPYDSAHISQNWLLIQCHLYYDYLAETKSRGWKWICFMLSRLTGRACEWAEPMVATHQPCLYDPGQFYTLFNLVYLFQHPDPLEMFWGGGLTRQLAAACSSPGLSRDPALQSTPAG